MYRDFKICLLETFSQNGSPTSTDLRNVNGYNQRILSLFVLSLLGSPKQSMRAYARRGQYHTIVEIGTRFSYYFNAIIKNNFKFEYFSIF